MRSGFSFSRQLKSAYPFLTWMPNCARYHAAIAFGSRAFINTPPMPVTFSISAAFLMLSCDEDRVDQRQPAAKSKAPTVINRSVFMVIVIPKQLTNATSGGQRRVAIGQRGFGGGFGGIVGGHFSLGGGDHRVVSGEGRVGRDEIRVTRHRRFDHERLRDFVFGAE